MLSHYCRTFVFFFFVASAIGQDNPLTWPPKIDGERHVYKTVGERELCLWRIAPDKAETDAKVHSSTPAIVFFFGGGWNSGTPEQFLPQAQHLANRGMLAFVADYRVASRDRVKAVACVEDAKSAIRWIRANAEMLGVDPNRICAAGGSAGGHIACCTALIEGLDAEAEDKKISSVPNALALFNPAVVLSPLEGVQLEDAQKRKLNELTARMGVDPRQLSPAHHVRKGLPPAVIFHGEADTTVEITTVERFAELMTEAGNRCELNRFPGAPHGFFNLRNEPSAGKSGRSAKKSGEKTDNAGSKQTVRAGSNENRKWHARSLQQLDEFLVSLSWIAATR